MASSEAGVIVDVLSFVQVLCTDHIRFNCQATENDSVAELLGG